MSRSGWRDLAVRQQRAQPWFSSVGKMTLAISAEEEMGYERGLFDQTRAPDIEAVRKA